MTDPVSPVPPSAGELAERRLLLEECSAAFLDAFNRDDLDAVMAFFTPDAIYDEYNGRRAEGRDAIRRAFKPQFRGDFGVIRFRSEETFIDPAAGRVLMRWLCELTKDGVRRGWRGLDILHFTLEGLISEKHTYAKADRLALIENPPLPAAPDS